MLQHAKTTDTVELMRVKKGNTSKPLHECVREAVDIFMQQMSDHPVENIYSLVMSQVEKPLFEEVMKHCGNNQSRAAEILGISRGTLRKKLKIYDSD